MEGFDNFRNLTKLYLYGRRISFIEELQGCPLLEELHPKNVLTLGNSLQFRMYLERIFSGSPEIKRVLTFSSNAFTFITLFSDIFTLWAMDHHNLFTAFLVSSSSSVQLWFYRMGDSHIKLFEGLHKYALSLFADRSFSESVPVWMKGLETAVSLRNHLLMKKLFHHIAHALEKAGFSKKAAIAAEKGRRMSILLDQELEGLIECVPGVSKEQVFCLKNNLLRKSARYLRLSFDVWMKRCDGQGQELVCTGDLERFYGRSQPKLSTESFPSLPG